MGRKTAYTASQERGVSQHALPVPPLRQPISPRMAGGYMNAVATTPTLRVREFSPAELSGWDKLVRRFANHRVTHTLAWLRSLEASGFGSARFLVVEKDGEIVGCLPGLVSDVGPIRLFGS